MPLINATPYVKSGLLGCSWVYPLFLPEGVSEGPATKKEEYKPPENWK